MFVCRRPTLRGLFCPHIVGSLRSSRCRAHCGEGISIQIIEYRRIISLLVHGFLFCLVVFFSSRANAMGDMPTGCNYRGIAQAVATDQIQTAYSMSVECENELLRQQAKSFAEAMLRAQYLATAQILAALGKIEAARDRMSKAQNLARTELIPFDEMENSTSGFLLERSGRMDEAVRFYLPIAASYARARLAIIYLDRNQATAAADAAGAALKDEPTNSTALVVLGVLIEKTNPNQAFIQYKKAVEFATAGNPSIMPLRYLELPRANAGIARLGPRP